MFKNTIVVLLSLMISQTVFAEGETILYQPDVKCPQTHEEVKSLLSDIHALKQKFQSFECNEITSRFDNIEKILGSRDEFLGLIFDNEGKTVSAENAEKIQQYSSALTQEAGTLISLISQASTPGGFLSLGGGDNACQINQEDKWEGTARVMGALYEGVSFISKVAGPYGVPLQIGAEIINGAVLGLAAFEKSSRRIDFSEGVNEDDDEDGGFFKRQLYENSVCLLVKTNAEAQRILNPQRHLQQLSYVKSKVNDNLDRLFRTCSGCAQIMSAQNTDEAAGLYEQYTNSLDSSDAYTSNRRELYDLALSESSNMAWLDGEVSRYRNIVQSNSSGIGPSEALSDLEQVKKFLYETATKEFLKYYVERLKVYENESNYSVSRLVRTFDRQELAAIDERIDHSAVPNGYKEALAEMLGANLNYDDTTNYYAQNFDFVVRNYVQTFQFDYPSVYNLFLITNKSKYLNEYSSLASSQIIDSIRQWQKADLTQKLVNEYCSFFFNLSEHRYTISIKNICESDHFIQARLSASYVAFYFAELLSGPKRTYVESTWGPIDFNLESKLQTLTALDNLKNESTIFAELGVNFERLIREEKELEIFDLDDLFNDSRGSAPYELWHEAALASFTGRIQSLTPDGVEPLDLD